MRPVVAIYSTFMQRAVDQLIHDAALPRLGVTVIMDRAGLVGDDGETHQGLYDIALFRSVPNVTFLAPACAAELELMLNYAVSLDGPALIRFPKAPCANAGPVPALEEGKGVFVRRGRGRVVILALGPLCAQAGAAADMLAAEGLGVDVYNMRFIKPLDLAYLKSLLGGYEAAYLVEDAAASGGLGSAVGDLIQGWRLPLAYAHGGAPDAFLPQGSREELLSDCGLDAAGIAAAVRELTAGLKKGLSEPSVFRQATG
jgi:1-deoxy-D-xylulose-5-phosphate synthase